MCSVISSAFTGRNVPSPTCSVTYPIFTPFAFSLSSSSGVKCKPAVGAAAEPLCFAKTVWYLSLSSSFLVIYGGSGISPSSSRTFSNTPSYSNLTRRLPSFITSKISALSLPSPNTNLAPGFARLPGFKITSHVSSECLFKSKNSIAPPVPSFTP